MDKSGTLVRMAAATAGLVAIAVVCGLALQQIATDTRAQDQLVADLTQQVVMLENTVAAQDARIDALEKKGTPRPQAGRPDPALTYAVPVGDAPVLGRRDAPVTIVEFIDLQCPFCKRAQSTLEQVRKRYPDDVRIVFKHLPLPFHQRALPAAHALECARDQGVFWAMQDLVWEDQQNLSDEDLRARAARIDRVSLSRFDHCTSQRIHQDRIDAQMAEAARFGARGTPAFFINGRFLSGAQPEQAFAKLIDEELARVRASRVMPADYYRDVVEKNGVARVE